MIDPRTRRSNRRIVAAPQGEIESRYRRRFVLGAAAVALQFSGDAFAVSSHGDRSNHVALADYGGVPEASRAELINAFHAAFDDLKTMGGGRLTIAPGVYNLGPFSGGVAIAVSDLRNVTVDGRGAQLTMRTITKSTPTFFQFRDPDNIAIEGLRFKDFGTDLNVNWKGAHCIVVQTTKPCYGFRTSDCVAENVVAFLSAQQESAHKYTFEGFDIHATVRNAYYGVNPNFNGANSRVNLTTHNVRRAFIGYGLRNWDVTVNASADGVALGSNALIELAADNRGYVDSVNVNLTVSGNLKKYNGLVTFFHQSAPNVAQFIRNVKAQVTLDNVTGAAEAVFFFPYWDPVKGKLARSTINSWERIQLSAKVIGVYEGPLIVNSARSSASTNAIFIESGLAGNQDMADLPAYFHVHGTLPLAPVRSSKPAS